MERTETSDDVAVSVFFSFVLPPTRPSKPMLLQLQKRLLLRGRSKDCSVNASVPASQQNEGKPRTDRGSRWGCHRGWLRVR